MRCLGAGEDDEDLGRFHALLGREPFAFAEAISSILIFAIYNGDEPPVEAVRAAILLHPDDPGLHACLGCLLLRDHEVDAAVAEHRRALDLLERRREAGDGYVALVHPTVKAQGEEPGTEGVGNTQGDSAPIQLLEFVIHFALAEALRRQRRLTSALREIQAAEACLKVLRRRDADDSGWVCTILAATLQRLTIEIRRALAMPMPAILDAEAGQR